MRFILACLTISGVMAFLILRLLDRLADVTWGILP
jgi:hypothetical protein